MSLDGITIKPNKTKTLREYTLLQRLKKICSDLTICHFNGSSCPAGTAVCCDECAIKKGYLPFIIEEDLNGYSGFSETGFLNSEMGCILPLELRSVKCIGYLCETAIAEVITQHGQDYFDGLTALKEVMEELEGIINATQVNE